MCVIILQVIVEKKKHLLGSVQEVVEEGVQFPGVRALPIMAYTGRLRKKGVYLGIGKGRNFTTVEPLHNGHLPPCKGIQAQSRMLDSTPWIPDSRYWIPDLFQWNLDSGFQLLVGFRIPWAVLRILRPRIPDSTRKNFPDAGIPIPLHEARHLLVKLCGFSSLGLKSIFRIE